MTGAARRELAETYGVRPIRRGYAVVVIPWALDDVGPGLTRALYRRLVKESVTVEMKRHPRLAWRVDRWTGDSGGWPEIRVSGPVAPLYAFLEEYGAVRL